MFRIVRYFAQTSEKPLYCTKYVLTENLSILINIIEIVLN